jgi:hypothetical protein
MRHLISLPLVTLALLFVAGCSPSELVVDEVAVVDTNDADDALTEEVEHPFDIIVAGMSAQGATGAEAAWAKERPTLLLFAASW